MGILSWVKGLFGSGESHDSVNTEHKALETLVKTANELDSLGLIAEANRIDALLTEMVKNNKHGVGAVEDGANGVIPWVGATGAPTKHHAPTIGYSASIQFNKDGGSFSVQIPKLPAPVVGQTHILPSDEELLEEMEWLEENGCPLPSKDDGPLVYVEKVMAIRKEIGMEELPLKVHRMMALKESLAASDVGMPLDKVVEDDGPPDDPPDEVEEEMSEDEREASFEWFDE